MSNAAMIEREDRHHRLSGWRLRIGLLTEAVGSVDP